jgi:hypothetical protein
LAAEDEKVKFQNLIFIAFLIIGTYVNADEDCPFTFVGESKSTLIGFIANERTTTQWSATEKRTITTNLGNFRIVASIDNNQIHEDTGWSIYSGQRFWPVHVNGPAVKLASVGSFLDKMGKDHCVYYASIDATGYEKWSLFSNTQTSGLQAPKASDVENFYKLNTTCINSGGVYLYTEEPPCRKPKLLAVSDIDNNKQIEYWATEPYKWDDGLTV